MSAANDREITDMAELCAMLKSAASVVRLYGDRGTIRITLEDGRTLDLWATQEDGSLYAYIRSEDGIK